MASEEHPGQHPEAGKQTPEHPQSQDVDGEYPVTGFFPIDKWSKLLLGLIAIFSLGIFVPVFLNRELTVLGAPWLFYAFPVSIIVLSTIWLILTYTVVE